MSQLTVSIRVTGAHLYRNQPENTKLKPETEALPHQSLGSRAHTCRPFRNGITQPTCTFNTNHTPADARHQARDKSLTMQEPNRRAQNQNPPPTTTDHRGSLGASHQPNSVIFTLLCWGRPARSVADCTFMPPPKDTKAEKNPTPT